MSNLLSIGKAIYSALSSISGVKIYPLVADNDAKYPFAVYRRVGYSPHTTKDGLHEITTDIEISVVCEKYASSIEVAETIISKLKGIELGGYDLEILLTNAYEEYEGDSFVQKLTFTINQIKK